jgi:hypothetical protein
MKENLDSELIISLIKDDLINSKLVNGLMDAGLRTIDIRRSGDALNGLAEEIYERLEEQLP